MWDIPAMPFIAAAGAIIAASVLIAAVHNASLDGEAYARDYCAEHGAIAVGQYCLTEAEIILRRVPERF